MKKKTTIALLALAFIATFLGSCKHYCKTNPFPVFKLVDFDSAALSNVILKIYAQDGRFTNPISTQLFTNRPDPGPGYSNIGNGNGAGSYYISVGFFYDATLEFPVIGKTYYLKGLNVMHDTWKDINCTNSFSYYLNDTFHSVPMQPVRDVQGEVIIYR